MSIEQFRSWHSLAAVFKWVIPIILIPTLIIAYYTEDIQETAAMAILGMAWMFLANITHAWTSRIMRQYGGDNKWHSSR